MPGLVQGMTISETRRMKQFFVYILASRSGGAIYVGVTNDLVRRVHGHKNGMAKGHTKNYRINKLVHFECYETARRYSAREEYQTLVKSVENEIDWKRKSNVAGFIRRYCRQITVSLPA